MPSQSLITRCSFGTNWENKNGTFNLCVKDGYPVQWLMRHRWWTELETHTPSNKQRLSSWTSWPIHCYIYSSIPAHSDSERRFHRRTKPDYKLCIKAALRNRNRQEKQDRTSSGGLRLKRLNGGGGAGGGGGAPLPHCELMVPAYSLALSDWWKFPIFLLSIEKH